MLGHDQHYFLHFNLPYILAHYSFLITQNLVIGYHLYHVFYLCRISFWK